MAKVSSPPLKLAAKIGHVYVSPELANRWRDEVHIPFSACTACPLHRTALNHVLAKGDVPADLVFVGEGPGHSEDVDGIPFDPNAPAGEILYALLADLKRQLRKSFTVLVTNVVACRPNDMHQQDIPNRKLNGFKTVWVPGYQNRAPSPEESHACRPRLDRILEIAQPKVVVCLGRIASKFVSTDLPTVNVYHPSYIARSGGIGSLDYKRVLLSLVKEVPRYL